MVFFFVSAGSDEERGDGDGNGNGDGDKPPARCCMMRQRLGPVS